MGITKEEFVEAFTKNNQFIKAEERRKVIWEAKKKRYEIDNLKSIVTLKAKKNQLKCGRIE